MYIFPCVCVGHLYIMKEIRLIIERIVTHTIPQTYVFNVFVVGIFLRGENTPLWEGFLHYEKCVFLRSKDISLQLRSCVLAFTRSKRLRCCGRTAEEVLCKGDTIHLSVLHTGYPLVHKLLTCFSSEYFLFRQKYLYVKNNHIHQAYLFSM